MAGPGVTECASEEERARVSNFFLSLDDTFLDLVFSFGRGLLMWETVTTTSFALRVTVG